MRVLLPSLNALRVFEAAARQGSFKRAADELYITPTAVSHQVRLLEESLGVKLFRREPRPIMLTEAGQQLFPTVRGAFDLLRSGVQSVKQLGAQSTMTVTTTPAFASYWLIPRLSQAKQAAQPADLIVQATEHVADLHSGEADVALRYSSRAAHGLVSVELLNDRYLPVCKPSLLQGQDTLNGVHGLIADLPLIHYEWKQRGDDAPSWPKWVAAAGAHYKDATALPNPLNGIRFSEEIHAIEAVLDGQGVGLLSSAIVDRAMAKGLLVQAHPFDLDGLSLFAVFSSASPKRAIIESFIHALRRMPDIPENDLDTEGAVVCP